MKPLTIRKWGIDNLCSTCYEKLSQWPRWKEEDIVKEFNNEENSPVSDVTANVAFAFKFTNKKRRISNLAHKKYVKRRYPKRKLDYSSFKPMLDENRMRELGYNVQ